MMQSIEEIVAVVDQHSAIIAQQGNLFAESKKLLEEIRDGQKLILMVTAKNGLTIQQLSGVLGRHYNTVGGYLHCYVENGIEILRDDKGKPRLPYKVSYAEAMKIKARIDAGEKFLTPRSVKLNN